MTRLSGAVWSHGDSSFGAWDEPEHRAPQPVQCDWYTRNAVCPACAFVYDERGDCDCTRWSWAREREGRR